MKAAVRTRYGPPDVVEISEVESRAAGEHELLVKVHATTVNRTDCHHRSGKPWIMRPLLSGLARPRRRMLGNEFAGQVVAAGNGVTSFQVGARVTAVCAGPQLELVRKLGADRVIDYTAGDFTRAGPDYDVVFDAAGQSSRYVETGQKIGNVVIIVGPPR